MEIGADCENRTRLGRVETCCLSLKKPAHNRSQARLLSNGDNSSLTTFVSYLLSQVDRISPAAGCSGIQSPGIPCLDSTIAAPLCLTRARITIVLPMVE